MTRSLRYAVLLPFLWAVAGQPASAHALAPQLVEARPDESRGDQFEGPRGPSGSEERHIGPYRVLRELGAGGMGRVYLAESIGRIRRRVALKVLNEGEFSPRVLTQFEVEAQALAQLEHEHIARLYETGQDVDGRPWMAMEWVDGEPLTSYCDRRELALDARLELFAQIARAVEYMHSRGVLHGDLKPANILVHERAGRAIPKLIDLGLARVGGASSEATDIVMGTPAYMAPEHFDAGSNAVDERADVFALGIVLRELLIGSANDAAFDSHRARSPWLASLRPRLAPSRDLEAHPERAPLLARLRRASARELHARLRAGLDGVVQRASALRRDSRTPNAGVLAREIESALARHARKGVFARAAVTLSAAAALGGALGASISAIVS